VQPDSPSAGSFLADRAERLCHRIDHPIDVRLGVRRRDEEQVDARNDEPALEGCQNFQPGAMAYPVRDMVDSGADRSPQPETISGVAGSWLESEALLQSMSNPRPGAAGEFHDDADNHLVAVADSGTDQHGGSPAHRCVQILGEEFRVAAEPIHERLRKGVSRANHYLNREVGAESGSGRVAIAALALAMAPEPRGWLVRVGGYRAYRLRAGVIRELGRRARGPIGLGIDPTAEVEIGGVAWAPGDRFLLCSNALSEAMSKKRIGAVLRLSSPSVIAHVLANQAEKRGARDGVNLHVVATHEPLEFGTSRRPRPDRAHAGAPREATDSEGGHTARGWPDSDAPNEDARDRQTTVEARPQARTSDPQPDAETEALGEPRLESVDLASIIDSELPLQRSVIRRRSLVVLKELDWKAPPALADVRQLRFVIRTLLDRVIHATCPSGDVYLGSLYRPGASSTPGTHRVRVRFQRLAGAIAASSDSSEARLSSELVVARDLVEGMGGCFRVDVASSHTALSIYLPASDAATR